jgi:tetratricopeptide (TPR) repeat protein
VARKKDVTVNEMLDLIAPRVETELADQPDVRAQVLRTIGSAYASEGQYDQAEEKLRAALAAQTTLYGEESAAVTATMVELGVLSYRQLKFEAASQLLEKAVGFYRRQQHTNSPDYSPAQFVLALDSLGDVKCNQGDGKSGLALMNEALQVSSAANLHGNERAVYLYAKADLGAALISLGDAEKGKALLREAIAEYQQISTEPRWELGVFFMALGTAELDNNQLDSADKNLAQGERIIRRSLGDENGYLANDLNQQAILFLRKNNLHAAEEKARESLAILQKVYRNKLSWTTPLSTLGDVLAKAERAGEAEDCYRQTLTILEEQPTKNYSFVVSLRIRLSQSLLAQNRLEEGKSVAVEAEEQARKYLGSDSPLTKAAEENLAKLRRD